MKQHPEEIIYLDRSSAKEAREKVYQQRALLLLYGDSFCSRLLYRWILPLVARLPFFSLLYGWLQKRPASAAKIAPFVQEFGVDLSEYKKTLPEFSSFNDFFIRELKEGARPIDSDPRQAIIPADGRYLFYEGIKSDQPFVVKGHRFDLKTFLGSLDLAQEYEGGVMVVARLCPSDYHRFHLPFAAKANEPQLINGFLYSVSPFAIQKRPAIFSENKRTLTALSSPIFGSVLYIAVGATCVGRICHTFPRGKELEKGAEMGYFEFGGSALVLLFAKGALELDCDLLEASRQGKEVRCLFGQSMGRGPL